MPKNLLFALVVYCFLYALVAREIGGVQVGVFIEGLLFITLIFTIVKAKQESWKNLNNDLFFLILFWLIISVLEVMNPNSAFLGWLGEIRTTALYPFLIVMLGLVILKTNRDLDIFLILVICLSTLASLNGLKQLYIGLSNGEKTFLAQNSSTHLLWDRLRVFSFYSDAGQFGASQGHIGFISFMLCLLPIKTWKRILLVAIAGLNLYGMLISGTRGALFGLIASIFVALFLSKNWKAMVIGGFVSISLLYLLKFTLIGNANYQIFRLRTALDPQDASLHVRISTQQNLKSYMEDYPFGGGLGVIGYFGQHYNADKYLSTVPPDSYYVKIWAMYGVVGLTIWFSIMLFILGKGCGLIWNIRDGPLRIKLIALSAGSAGILVCSYGNEVINIMPTSIIIYLSWVFIDMAPKLENSENSTLLT